MVSPPIAEFETVCAYFAYPISVPAELQGAKVVKFVVANPLPTGVTADDIIFSNQYGLTSTVTFPKEGDYYICVEYYM